jgi:hypothetical protein
MCDAYLVYALQEHIVTLINLDILSSRIWALAFGGWAVSKSLTALWSEDSSPHYVELARRVRIYGSAQHVGAPRQTRLSYFDDEGCKDIGLPVGCKNGSERYILIAVFI